MHVSKNTFLCIVGMFVVSWGTQGVRQVLTPAIQFGKQYFGFFNRGALVAVQTANNFIQDQG
jgi:hypothetical protein